MAATLTVLVGWIETHHVLADENCRTTKK